MACIAAPDRRRPVTEQARRRIDDPDAELRRLVLAMYHHGSTLWADSTCGRGGAGGQVMTTSYHNELMDVLVEQAARLATDINEAKITGRPVYGYVLEDADALWQEWHPGSASIVGPARPSRRAGPDGRPV